MAVNLITRAQLARLAQVSKPAITQAVAGKLAVACVGEGRGLKLDHSHPAVQAYIAEARDGTKPSGKQIPSKPPATSSNSVSTHDGVVSLENESGQVINLEELTVREIALNYGGVAQFAAYVKALKDIADYKNKEQQHLVKRGELIERETVAASLLMLVDVAYKRLISEMPAAVMQQLVPLIQSGGEDSERDGKQLLVDAVSKILKDCKTEVRKKLKTLDKSGGHNEQK